MLIDFFFELRRRGLKVTTHEWMALMEALAKGLHGSSLDGFYRLARALCAKDASQLDAFDQAFLWHFRGVGVEAVDVSEELLSWLQDPKRFAGLSEEQRRMLESLDLERLRQMFEERLQEQRERHDGGNRWIGTGGTSPFGHGGYHPSGLRIGGPGGARSAMQVAAERRFRGYRKDLTLDVRQIDLALRGLRQLGREGAEEELDLELSIDETCRNAGEIELVFRPPRRNRVRLVLLMDVGGSMDPYAHLVSRLFTAASRSGRFAGFRSYYFHNCIYDEVYEDPAFRQAVPVDDLLASSDRDEKLVIVGDALMHPSELLAPAGAIFFHYNPAESGLVWLKRIAHHFRRAAWLNPEPRRYWDHPTVETIGSVFPMWELTLEGLEASVRYLVQGGDRGGGAGRGRAGSAYR